MKDIIIPARELEPGDYVKFWNATVKSVEIVDTNRGPAGDLCKVAFQYHRPDFRWQVAAEYMVEVAR